MRIRVHRCAWLVASLLFADGGAVQFRSKTGAFLVTVFSAPVPLRVGAADLSVLVQTAQDAGVVVDAEILLRLSRSGERDITVAATRAQATNKLLYASHLILPSPGTWHINVSLTWKGKSVDVPAEIEVLAQGDPLNSYWLYFALVPAVVSLFGVNQWLKRRRARTIYVAANAGAIHRKSSAGM